MHSIEKRVDSSLLDTTSYVAGFPNYSSSTSCPTMCTTNPSYILVVPCRAWGSGRMASSGGVPTHPTIHCWFWRNHKIRDNFSSCTYVKRGRILFTTCMLWTLMRSLTSRGPRRCDFSRQRNRKNESIWRHSSRNASTSHLLFYMCTYSWELRPRQWWNVLKVALQ